MTKRRAKGKRKTRENRKSAKEKKEQNRLGNEHYFEAILQLRDFREDQLNNILDHIEENQCRISKHIEHKNGLDLYLSSQKFIQKLNKWIKERYHCQTTVTSTLHTRDSKANKDLYRLTVLVNFFNCKVGDVVEIDGEKVKITSLGKKPSGKVICSGKRVFIDKKHLK